MRKVRTVKKARKRARKPGMSAWLITSEEHAPRRRRHVRDRIVAILSSRWSSDMVLRVLATLHHSAEYTLSEQATYARRPADDPYPVELIAIDGARYEGEM